MVLSVEASSTNGFKISKRLVLYTFNAASNVGFNVIRRNNQRDLRHAMLLFVLNVIYHISTLTIPVSFN